MALLRNGLHNVVLGIAQNVRGVVDYELRDLAGTCYRAMGEQYARQASVQSDAPAILEDTASVRPDDESLDLPPPSPLWFLPIDLTTMEEEHRQWQPRPGHAYAAHLLCHLADA